MDWDNTRQTNVVETWGIEWDRLLKQEEICIPKLRCAKLHIFSQCWNQLNLSSETLCHQTGGKSHCSHCWLFSLSLGLHRRMDTYRAHRKSSRHLYALLNRVNTEVLSVKAWMGMWILAIFIWSLRSRHFCLGWSPIDPSCLGPPGSYIFLRPLTLLGPFLISSHSQGFCHLSTLEKWPFPFCYLQRQPFHSCWASRTP